MSTSRLTAQEGADCRAQSPSPSAPSGRGSVGAHRVAPHRVEAHSPREWAEVIRDV
ncbi:hypothetical protein JCM18899A_53620 [Nocardioides sp. AN3]